jgi:UDP-GlcNAc:undecaprenyl-phosphate/decaprenyl-phosphate GlcNAc-1-phosphate transferase
MSLAPWAQVAAIMSFPVNYYLIAFLSACLTTFLSVPLWRNWSHKTGLVDDPGHRKIHDRPVALAGGLAVLTGLLVPLLIGAALAIDLPLIRQNLTGTGVASNSIGLLGYGFSRRAIQLVGIFAGALGMGLLGWLDDKHELRPGAKFAGQLILAALVAAAGVRITLFVPNLLFSYAVTVLWILTVTNAFNFMDNMNGLCAGVGLIGAWWFAFSAAAQGQYLVALLALSTCGALIGFLPYNFPRASIFLGDAGSHVVGYLLAILAILPHFYSKQNPRAWAVLSPLLILAVPLADLVWVVALRLRAGQPFYVGDTNHLSHRLVRRGWSRTQAVLLIWLLAAVIGGFSLL